MHDRRRKGDVLICSHGEFLDVEHRRGLVLAEKRVPGLFGGLDALALQGWRQVGVDAFRHGLTRLGFGGRARCEPDATGVLDPAIRTLVFVVGKNLRDDVDL